MIGVICARNPGRRNLGMYSVDLSAASYFRTTGKPFELLTHNGHERVGRLNYRKIRRFEDYLNYDAIVFWGDFQQNPIWGAKDFARRYAKERRGDVSNGVRAWRQLCLLEGQPGQRPRFYSIGTCFLGWETAIDGAGLPREAYRDCLAGFDAIIPRDTLSFSTLRDFGLQNIDQGFDCASLVEAEMSVVQSHPSFAYAFGRTIEGETARAVSRAISRHLHRTPKRIQWLLGRFQRKNLGPRYAHAREQLRETEFLVTDIYHLAVNALGLGCDVYCIGRSDGPFDDTCADLKKDLLMKMVGRSDDYLAISDDIDPSKVSLWVSERVAARAREKSFEFHSLARAFRDKLDNIFRAHPR